MFSKESVEKKKEKIIISVRREGSIFLGKEMCTRAAA